MMNDGLVTGRIEGLDAWRAVLMLLGLLLHAASFRENLPLFDAVTFASTMFRMGAFFAIAGLLTGISLSRRPASGWLRRRLIRIGVPATIGVCLLSPPTSMMIAALPSSRGVPPLLFDWHHLWFLFALLLYCPLSTAIHRFDERYGLDALVIRNGAPRQVRLLVLLGVPIVSLVAMIVVLGVVHAVFPARYWPPLLQLRLIAGYAPLYATGFALSRSAVLREALLMRMTLPTAIVLATGLCYVALVLHPASFPQAWMTILVDIGSALCPPAAALLIIRAAMAMTHVSHVLSRLCAAAFTIYIVHFPIIVAATMAFAHVGWHPYVEYAIAVTLGGTLSYLFHVRVVERYPIAAFLFNGAALPRRVGDTARIA